MAEQEDRFEGVEEVAERLLVDPQTVRRWIKSGKLKAYKPGREFRIKSTDLEEFLETREVAPKELGPLSLGEILREAGTTPYYLPLRLEDVVDLYESASFEKAQAITQALIAERRAFDAFLTQNPDTKIAGKWRTAVHTNMWAALVGMQGAAQREIDRMREEGNEAGAEAVREAYGLTVQEMAGVS